MCKHENKKPIKTTGKNITYLCTDCNEKIVIGKVHPRMKKTAIKEVKSIIDRILGR